MSYSQYGEDLVVKEIFSDYVGRLLEIGAWHPKQFSNSRLLIDRGWEAILIEPSPGPVQRLVREYGRNDRVKVIAGLMTPSDSIVQRLDVTDDAVSTTEPSVLQTWAKDGGYYGSLWMRSLPLPAFLNQFGGNWDFVSIDTEGTSVELAVALLNSGALPRALCIEHDGRLVELLQHAQQRGYRAVHTNGTNVILAR